MKIINNDFKTIQLATFFTDVECRDTLVYRFLLPKLLTIHTNKLINKRQMNKKLGDLYGAYFRAVNERVGNLSVISIKLTFVNPQIVDDSNLLDDALKLFNEVLFDHDSFSEEVFAEEKRMMLEYWQTLKDKKRAYANLKFAEHFFKGDILGYKGQAIIRDLKKITSKDLFTYYQNVFLNNQRSVVVNGHLLESDQTKIKENLSYKELKTAKFIANPKKSRALAIINEKADMKQAMLKFGFKLAVFRNDDLFQATVLFNTILGGYAESRLFKVIREQEGLCYDVSSSYDQFKGVLVISSGVDAKQKDYALAAIKKLVAHLIKDGVLEQELSNAKAFYIHQLKSSLDNQSVLTNRAFYNELLNDKQTIDQKLLQINKVSVKDVNAVALKLELDTIYILHGGAND